MRVSRLFAPNITRPVNERDIVGLSTERLMERASLLRYCKNPGGRIDFLPLGKQVTYNMEQMLREISYNYGAQEVKLTGLQPDRYLKSSGRWEKFCRDTFQIKDSELVLNPTHEEYVLSLLKDTSFTSHRSLPLFIFQFGDVYRKLRNQAFRGGLRNSEILVYEGYGVFNPEEQPTNYFQFFDNVFRDFFKRINLPFTVSSKNENFARYQFETPSGLEKCLDEEGKNEKNVLEISQIFVNPVSMSKKVGIWFPTKNGNIRPVLVSAGLGIYRTLYAIIDKNKDEKGIRWPDGMEPFTYAVIPLYIRASEQREMAEKIYNELKQEGVRVILDDRDRIGVRKKSLDLIGIKKKVIVYKDKDGSINVVEENREGEIKPYEQKVYGRADKTKH